MSSGNKNINTLLVKQYWNESGQPKTLFMELFTSNSKRLLNSLLFSVSILIVIVLFGKPSNAYEVCNKTRNKDINVAFGWYQPSTPGSRCVPGRVCHKVGGYPGGWNSTGWYTLEPGECHRPSVSNNVELMYYRAHSSGREIVWTKHHKTFCVPRRAFQIDYTNNRQDSDLNNCSDLGFERLKGGVNLGLD